MSDDRKAALDKAAWSACVAGGAALAGILESAELVAYTAMLVALCYLFKYVRMRHD